MTETITETDLMAAIEAFIEVPRQPDEYTMQDIQTRHHLTRNEAARAIEHMREAGIEVTERQIIAANGKPQTLYRIKSPAG